RPHASAGGGSLDARRLAREVQPPAGSRRLRVWPYGGAGEGVPVAEREGPARLPPRGDEADEAVPRLGHDGRARPSPRAGPGPLDGGDPDREHRDGLPPARRRGVLHQRADQGSRQGRPLRGPEERSAAGEGEEGEEAWQDAGPLSRTASTTSHRSRSSYPSARRLAEE